MDITLKKVLESLPFYKSILRMDITLKIVLEKMAILQKYSENEDHFEKSFRKYGHFTKVF